MSSEKLLGGRTTSLSMLAGSMLLGFHIDSGSTRIPALLFGRLIDDVLSYPEYYLHAKINTNRLVEKYFMYTYKRFFLFI